MAGGYGAPLMAAGGMAAASAPMASMAPPTAGGPRSFFTAMRPPAPTGYAGGSGGLGLG